MLTKEKSCFSNVLLDILADVNRIFDTFSTVSRSPRLWTLLLSLLRICWPSHNLHGIDCVLACNFNSNYHITYHMAHNLLEVGAANMLSIKLLHITFT